MTPAQRSMCSVLMQHMGRFYENPENERRFREWKERRTNPATDLMPAAPSGCRQLAGKRLTANLTASRTFSS